MFYLQLKKLPCLPPVTIAQSRIPRTQNLFQFTACYDYRAATKQFASELQFARPQISAANNLEAE
jgi:hypothetical protein